MERERGNVTIGVLLVLAALFITAGMVWWLSASASRSAAPDHRTSGSAAPSPGADAGRDGAAPSAPPAVEPARLEDAFAADPDAWATVRGRVIRPDGRPVPGADLALAATPRELQGLVAGLARSAGDDPTGDAGMLARSDREGRFRLVLREARGERPSGLLAVRQGASDLSLRRLARIVAGLNDLGEVVLEAGSVVRGRIVDVSGVPLPDAQVTVEYTSSQPLRAGALPHPDLLASARLLRTARTGPDGAFAVAGLQPLAASVSVQAPGRSLLTLLAVPLTLDHAAELGDLTLDTGASIGGVLLHPGNGRPAAGVSVTVRATDAVTRVERDGRVIEGREQGSASTDAEGRFLISGLAQGRFSLHAIARGYVWSRLKGVRTGSTDVRMQLRQGGTLRLAVRDAGTGQPVTDARVEATLPRAAREQLWSDWQFQTASGSDAGLPAGIYQVTGAGAEGTLLTVTAPGHTPQQLLADAVQPGETRKLSLALESGATLAGQVRDMAGRPVAGAVVRAVPGPEVGFGQPRQVLADEAGAFAFDGLSPGAWELRAEARGHLPVSVAMVDSAGPASRPLELLMTAAARLEGRVTGPGGGPVSDAAVYALRLDRAPLSLPAADGGPLESWQSQQDELTAAPAGDGTFALEGLYGGVYLLTASRAAAASTLGRLRSLAAQPERVLPADVARVEASLGASATADLVLAQPASLRGRVTADRAPVAGALVLVLGERPAGWAVVGSATCDEGGLYELHDLLPGEYGVAAASNAQVLPRAASVSLRAGDTTRLDLVFAGSALEGRVVDGQTGAPAAGASVAIRVRNARQAPEGTLAALGRGAVVAARRREAPFDYTAVSDAQGRFRMAHVPSGQYVLDVLGGGWLRDGSTPVEVTDAGVAGDITVRALKGAVIEGRLLPEAGTTLGRRLTVELFSAERRGVVAWSWAREGPFRFDGLAGGDYELRVDDKSRRGGLMRRIELSVTTGEVRRVDVPLQAVSKR